MLDDELTMLPMKQHGILDTSNDIDVVQAQHYIKNRCQTYVNKFFGKYLDTWWFCKLHITDD